MVIKVDSTNAYKKILDDFVEAIKVIRDEATKTLDIYFDKIQK